ncbi:MAG: cytidyltransferase [Glaciihabitans sp.]|nr:cytidyltransferase [Glaciihabitans sp.]MCU1533659.1 cytidyltransferase [Glaciihabitans sp.]MDQ1556032.1 glycerol-3-phosphate cytidylyltransferase [Actinomycetota bacterium]
MSQRKIGYARGAFDLFHVGHVNLLRRARAACDYLVVGVVPDETLTARKGMRPVVPLGERVDIVRSMRFVDEVVVDASDDVMETWRQVGFTHFFKGDDWRGTEKGQALEATLSQVGVEVVYFPYTTTTSSTGLRRALDMLG